QNAERHRDDGRQHEAAKDPPYRHADVEQEAVLGQEFEALLQHGQRVGEKRFGHVAAKSCPCPQSYEQDEERKAVGHALLGCHGIQGSYHRLILKAERRLRSVPLPCWEAGPSRRGRVYLMKLVSTRSSIFGIDLMMPISS